MGIPPVPEDDYLSDHDLRLHAETLVFGSGRPILVPPPSAHSKPSSWRGMARGLRRGRLPTHIVTMTNRRTAAATRTAPAFAGHLAVHGVEAVVTGVQLAGRGIDTMSADCAMSCGADLIVMAAFGQSRLRDFVLRPRRACLPIRRPRCSSRTESL